MEQRGRLRYEEKIEETRAKAELSANHIGIFVSILIIILSWSVLGYGIGKKMEAIWISAILIAAIFFTMVFLYVINILVRFEISSHLPVKVYDEGVLMPTTSFERIISGKRPFIYFHNLASIRLIRAHEPDKKDILIAVTKRRRSYAKRFDRSSEEAANIIEAVQKANPKTKIMIRE